MTGRNVSLRKWLRAAACSMTTMLVCNGASALDFKGVELGQPLWASVERSVFSDMDCNPMQLDADDYQDLVRGMQSVLPGVNKLCAASTTIATVPAHVTIALDGSRRVLRLTFEFPGKDYSRVLQAVTQKFGDGVREIRDPLDESVWWDFEDGTTLAVHRTAGDGSGSVESEESMIGLAEYGLQSQTPEGDL